MSTRYFSEEEVERIAMDDSPYEVVKEESLSSGRWHEHMTSVVRTEDGKLYSIAWGSGLTEIQENEYYAGEYPEVSEHTKFHVRETTEYLTDEEAEKFSDSHVDGDIESLRLVTDADAVDKCFSSEKVAEIEQALELFNSLNVLDQVSNFVHYRKAGERYLNTLLNYAKRNGN